MFTKTESHSYYPGDKYKKKYAPSVYTCMDGWS